MQYWYYPTLGKETTIRETQAVQTDQDDQGQFGLLSVASGWLHTGQIDSH